MNCKFHKDMEAIDNCVICGAPLCEECKKFHDKHFGCQNCCSREVHRNYLSYKNGFKYNIITLGCAALFLVLYIVAICLNIFETKFIILGAVVLAILVPVSIYLTIINHKKLKYYEELIKLKSDDIKNDEENKI